MADIIVIDNYDSFTWNIVEYISALTPRQIDVYRNDKISVSQLQQLAPKLLVISPGPGHPETDAGISADVVAKFAGKIPILGVCMGQQCMFTVFGGKVEQTGEILHGKTSLVRHDGKGIYKGLPQDIAVTRYHSLAGTLASLPDVLEVTCRTEGGIIMGVRHREYAIEGVQFHPESILSEGGKMMLENFLKLEGGTWAENPEVGMSRPPTGKKTILETIHEQRLKDIAHAKRTPGTTPADLQTLLRLDQAYPLIDFPKRLRQNTPEPGVMAEIKRASPSKGDIDISANAAQQALLYARGGASVISVLTEPTWFKGSLLDMRAARDAVAHMPNRPAILRKDFIVDTYQIDEARLYGADTILLIVAMLSEKQLFDLYAYAQTLGMEPLVEVNNPQEMAVAMRLGAKVVGVNNRNLHDFVVDLETTSKLAKGLQTGVTLCALSGITTRADVEKYLEEGVHAVLVGEALMRSADKGAFIDALRGRSAQEQRRAVPIVKICGTRTPEAAVAAAEAGADLIGIIMVEGRRRTVDIDGAKQIVDAVRGTHKRAPAPFELASDWFSHSLQVIRSGPRALVVGVFQNQPLSYILEAQRQAGLDMVQLHGEEPLEWANLIPCPVLRAFGVDDLAIGKEGLHALPLLDGTSASGVKGGTGETLDWSAAATIQTPYLLAGGLTPDNVAKALAQTNASGVDVSSGVEDPNGNQDIAKITAFIKAAKHVA
ncbi:anthranilate synthase / indole-3-glycerol phosphate synthase [Savitreella phatthalungensis]